MKNLKINKLISGVLGVMIVLLASQALALNPVPEIRLGFPGMSSHSAVHVPPEASFEISFEDEDGGPLGPRKYRYLIKEAVVNGVEISSPYHYNHHVDELINFDDPDWSEWLDLHLVENEPAQLTMPVLENGGYYLCAVQILDADGTPSMSRVYNEAVVNFHVSDQFRPQVLVNEVFLGTYNNEWSVDIASDQPLNFQLVASAESYNGQIESFRYGWDVSDPDDPNDPGWAMPAGQSEEVIVVPERMFGQGIHSLLVQAIDTNGFEYHYFGYLTVIPFISPEHQLSLLFVDQVVDHQSNRWPDADGSIAFDHEEYRNQYWSFLDGPEGVVGYDIQRDRMDHRDQVSYEVMVRYRSVLINARSHSQQSLFQEFRPANGQDKFVWLAPYQAQGGNLFLVGDRSMESFLENLDYMTPIIFESPQEYYELNNHTYVIGFGMTNNPDGSSHLRGPTMYPYLTAGLSVLDWSVPINKTIFGRINDAYIDRREACSGLKAMVLDDAFRTNHQVSSQAMIDTLQTNTNIDWRDGWGPSSDALEVAFPFTGDEFVDANITNQWTYWSHQDCEDGVDGACLEPMYKGVSRFDYQRKEHWDAGETDWPASEYSEGQLTEICGEMALKNLILPGGQIPNGTARVNDLTYGYLSYKSIANKPSGRADAYWGFDPYRFDAEESKKSVRWVLDYFGLQMNR